MLRHIRACGVPGRQRCSRRQCRGGHGGDAVVSALAVQDDGLYTCRWGDLQGSSDSTQKLFMYEFRTDRAIVTVLRPSSSRAQHWRSSRRPHHRGPRPPVHGANDISNPPQHRGHVRYRGPIPQLAQLRAVKTKVLQTIGTSCCMQHRGYRPAGLRGGLLPLFPGKASIRFCISILVSWKECRTHCRYEREGLAPSFAGCNQGCNGF